MSNSVKVSSNDSPADGMTRSEFLKLTATVAAAMGTITILPACSALQAGRNTTGRPGLNILVIQVDEMRAPSVYLPRAIRETYLPNLTKLADEGVDFTNHHIASSACGPSRTCLATGLYTHQTACFSSDVSLNLNTGFPTYGAMLRSLGYDTFWFGKWHLTYHPDGCLPEPYEAYGFTVPPGIGTCPDPMGAPYEGQERDPLISQQYIDWLANRPHNGAPWCATVSFVNPHDVGFYPNGAIELEKQAPSLFDSLPANFETKQDRINERKPALHQRLADVVNIIFGELPDSGVPAEPWIRLLDTYVWTQHLVDVQIGRVLDALALSPFSQDTVVIFTSDHGDYTGSHGLRGKCYGMYEEGIVVPFIVKDPTGTWTAAGNVPRTQLSSHVDLVPLLLTLATGNERWRGARQYEHLSTRLSLARILADPGAAGRPYAAHATDETSLAKSLTDFLGGDAVELEPVPDHVMGVAMPGGKFAQYAYWQPGTTNPEDVGMQFEGYDYRTRAGQLELHNSYGSSLPSDLEAIETGKQTLDQAIKNELEAPLPSYLRPVQEQALADWFAMNKDTGT